MVSLGCPKALVDSERILTQLRAEGYRLVPHYDDADLVIVNTCGFIDAAIAESLDAIGEALQENGRVIVTGCLGKRPDQVLAVHPKVLAITGPNALPEVMQAVHEQLPPAHAPYENLVPAQGVRLTPPHYAYLKIAEGCNQSCSFCIIPDLRGPLVSRPLGEILDEAERLAQAGVRELLVVSQDTGAYGVDLKYRVDLWKSRALATRIRVLAQELGAIAPWVRLHYLYPYPHLDDLIPLMAEGLILPYMDMPLQHAAPAVLKAMRRPAATERMLERIQSWRAHCPQLTLRSTMMVGFPGETDEDFQALLDFLADAELDRLGCFTYSPVAGAPANELPGAVPGALKAERQARLMEQQAEISARRLHSRIGSTLIALVDGREDGKIVARGPGDAPDIDGRIWIDDAWDLEAGDFVEVRITGADTHDLWGEPADPEE